MRCRLCKEGDEYLDQVFALYISAFPIDERRTTEHFADLIVSHPLFECHLLLEDDEFIGFLTTWQLNGFVFSEHFAIRDDLRGRNYGAQALAWLRKEKSKPIVLEVELPDTEISQRRICFYERNGFTLSQNGYEQPALEPGQNRVPLRIMSTHAAWLEGNFNQVKQIIHQEVYNLK